MNIIPHSQQMGTHSRDWGNRSGDEASLLARIRGAYLDMCQRQAANLLHEIEKEAAVGNDTSADLADRLRAIATEIEARKRA